VFFLYNFAGFREHGVSYINQFLGPFLLLAPLILAIEVISHCIRPISLALRLYANIFGDHLLVGIFSSLTVTSLGFPALLLLFGLLVAFIQSLVFTLLTSIYISMAESHDH
jgi:F-type H+-transporting ATPase subunit a